MSRMVKEEHIIKKQVENYSSLFSDKYQSCRFYALKGTAKDFIEKVYPNVIEM